MTDKRGVRTIAALGNYGVGNIGSEVLLSAFAAGVARRAPGVHVVAVSYDAEDTRVRHGLDARPHSRRPTPIVIDPVTEAEAAASARAPLGGVKDVVRRAPALFRMATAARSALRTLAKVAREPRELLHIRRTLDGADLLVFTGGGPLTDDFGGPWSHPYDLFRWALVARMRGMRVSFLSVGAGPIDRTLSRVFCRLAVSLANHRSFRDDRSRALMRSLGVGGDLRRSPDLAFGLDWGAREAAPLPARMRVGINPYPHSDARYIPGADPAEYERYVKMMGDFAAELLAQGHEVVLVPTQVVIDPLVGSDIAAVVRRTAGDEELSRFAVAPVNDLEELRAALEDLDIVVMTRFHGILLSLLAGLPVLGLAAHDRMVAVMEDSGQARHLQWLEDVTPESLRAGWADLVGDVERTREVAAKAVRTARAGIGDELDLLIGPLPAAAPFSRA